AHLRGSRAGLVAADDRETRDGGGIAEQAVLEGSRDPLGALEARERVDGGLEVVDEVRQEVRVVLSQRFAFPADDCGQASDEFPLNRYGQHAHAVGFDLAEPPRAIRAERVQGRLSYWEHPVDGALLPDQLEVCASDGEA